MFPFSRNERVKKWYAHNKGKVNREWEELGDMFFCAFFLISHIASLQKEILDFHQDEKKTIGAAWARFLLTVVKSKIYAFNSCIRHKE